MAKLTLDGWIFRLQFREDEYIPETDILHDTLLDVKGVFEVDGSHIDGAMSVTVLKSEYKTWLSASTAITRALSSI